MRAPSQRCRLSAGCVWFLLLALGDVMTTSAFYDNVPHICRDRPSGTTRLPSRRCDAYLECFAGMAFRRLCAPGTSFNPVTSACDLPRDADCTHQGAHQTHGSEVHQFRHLLDSGTLKRTSSRQPETKEHIANDPTMTPQEVEKPKPTDANDLEDSTHNSDTAELNKSSRVQYHPTIVITSPIRFHPSGVGLGRRLRRSVDGLMKASSHGMQVAHSNALLDMSADTAVGKRQIEPKTAVRLRSFNSNEQQHHQHSHPHHQDKEIERMKKQLQQLQKLKKQQQKLQRILMKNPAGPLAQTLKPYLRYHSASSKEVTGKSAKADQSGPITPRKESGYAKKKWGNSHRVNHKLFGSPRSMLPFIGRSKMPGFDAPQRQWKFTSRHPKRDAPAKKSYKTRQSNPSALVPTTNSGYSTAFPADLADSGSPEMSFPSNFYHSSNNPYDSSDERMMMNMFNKLKVETQDESSKMGTNLTPYDLGSFKRYGGSMNKYSYVPTSDYYFPNGQYSGYDNSSSKGFDPYPRISQYSKDLNNYYSPRYSGAKSIGGKSEYDDNYNRYGRNTQMYGPDAYTTDFANGGDNSGNEQQYQQDQGQETATATPIWIHPFARGGSYISDDDSQTQGNDKTSYDRPSRYDTSKSRHSLEGYNDDSYNPDSTYGENSEGYGTYNKDNEHMPIRRDTQHHYQQDSYPNGNNYQSDGLSKGGESRYLRQRQDREQYPRANDGAVYKNRATTGYADSRHGDEYAPSQYSTNSYQSQQKQASFQRNDNMYTQKQYGKHNDYNSNRGYNQKRKDEKYVYTTPRKYSKQRQQQNYEYDANMGYSQQTRDEHTGYTSDHNNPRKRQYSHNDYADSYSPGKQHHNIDYSSNTDYSQGMQNQYNNYDTNNGYQPEKQRKRNGYSPSRDYVQGQQVQRNAYAAKRGNTDERGYQQNEYSDKRNQNDRDGRQEQREDREQQEKDPYRHAKNRERSDRITDPDSYYNADNPGPWSKDNHRLPPEATYNGGRGGGSSGGQGGGGEPAQEGGTHAQYGRKPPDFDTFPFNFMPKHLTGPMFTNTGSLDFRKEAGYGHVGNVELDGNGDVQYDDTDHRVAPKKAVDDIPNPSTSDLRKNSEVKDIKKTGKIPGKAIIKNESDLKINTTGDSQENVSPKKSETFVVAAEGNEVKVRTKRHTGGTYQTHMKKSRYGAYPKTNSYNYSPNYQYPSKYNTYPQQYAHAYPPRLSSNQKFYQQNSNVHGQQYSRNRFFHQYLPRYKKDGRNLDVPHFAPKLNYDTSRFSPNLHYAPKMPNMPNAPEFHYAPKMPNMPNAPTLPSNMPNLPNAPQTPNAPKTPKAPKVPELDIDTKQYIPDLSHTFDMALNIDLPFNDGGFADQWQKSKFPEAKQGRVNNGYGTFPDQWHSSAYPDSKTSGGLKGYGDTFYQGSSDPYGTFYSKSMKNIYDNDFKKLDIGSKGDHQDYGFPDDPTKGDNFYMKKPDNIMYPGPLQSHELSTYNVGFDDITPSPKSQKQLFMETIHVGTGAAPDRKSSSSYGGLFGKSLDIKGFSSGYNDNWSDDKWSNDKWFNTKEYPNYKWSNDDKWSNDKWFSGKYPSEDPWASYSMDDRMSSKYGMPSSEDTRKEPQPKNGSASKLR